MEVAKTILAQLGGNKFLAMTGAKVLATENGLSIKLPIGKATGVEVTLAPDDTYTIQAYKGRGLNMKPMGEAAEMVYADNLQEVFTGITGLDVHL